ncbi:MAG: gamma-glutamyl-gamma-aminobutyrate hydrolase family protein [Deltaproteobacteria bacterium]|nr:gamma-glutamyl-gamma-aminobutyrate hydrolase family protein [Deltaproteobacteria bacterium]
MKTAGGKAKPVIGIVLQESAIPTFFFKADRPVVLLAENYLSWLFDMGAVPLMISSRTDRGDLAVVVERLDGIVFAGGPDLDPSTYGAASRVEYSAAAGSVGTRFHRPLHSAPQLGKDLFEIALYRAARDQGLPVLGLCRGMQLINVAEGGTLAQEIEGSSIEHYLTLDGWMHYHEIAIVPGTLGHELLQVERYLSSSVHHQAVERLGADLAIAATAPDGLAEIIEHRDRTRFAVGIQGHPEMTRTNLARFDQIFRRFVDRARER